jgi:hypothetical protein
MGSISFFLKVCSLSIFSGDISFSYQEDSFIHLRIIENAFIFYKLQFSFKSAVSLSINSLRKVHLIHSKYLYII